MDHNELREKVNSVLNLRALSGLTDEQAARVKDIAGLSSGSMMLNIALSGNPFVGYVWGRIAEIYGPESGGKTTLALHAVKEAQHIEDSSGKFMPTLFIDAEHSLDVSYAEALGIDLSRVAIAQPGYGEEALNVAEKAIKEGYRLVVVDSVAALTPKAEVEGDMGEAHVGLHARLMSQACRKLGPLVKQKGALLIFINQVRMKVGVVFGNPETRPGGKALDYWAGYLIEIRAPRSGKQTGKTLMGYGEVEESVELATKVAVSVRKNKVFPPHRKAEFVIEYGRGINRAKDTIAFLEWVGAFKSTAKSKSDVLKIPSKSKAYTPTGLLKILDEPEVQADVVEIIRNMEEHRDTHS